MSVKTLPEIAPKMLNPSLGGASNGKRDLVFMRDVYNLMPVLHKSAVVLADEALILDAEPDTIDKKREFLSKIASVSALIFKGGLTHHEENCHAWMNIMKEAKEDKDKLETFMLFSVMFTRVHLTMPLLLPAFGKCLPDDNTDEAATHMALIAVLEGLDTEDRRKLVTSLTSIGALSTLFDTAAIRKTLPTEIQQLLMGNDTLIQGQVKKRLEEIEAAKNAN